MAWMRGEDERSRISGSPRKPGGMLPKMARSAWPCASASVRCRAPLRSARCACAGFPCQAIEQASSSQVGKITSTAMRTSAPSRPTAFWRRMLERRRLVEQVARAPVQHSPVGV